MKNEEYNTDSVNALRQNQLVTIGDLQKFKAELLQEMQKLLSESKSNLQKKWLKSIDVRKLLSLSPGSLQNLRINGTLPYTKIGGMMYYNAEDVEKMMRKSL